MQPPLRRRRRISGGTGTRAPLDYDRLSDPILVRRASDGDPHALDALCRRHALRVERLCAHVLADPEDARDAAQDALARLCGRVGQYRGEAAFTTWLHRLAVNACHDVAERRRRQRWEPLEEDARVAPEDGPARVAELTELRGELRGHLAQLPESQARVLVLKDVLDLSFEEISDASGMAVGTAKCYAHRGRAGMRALLEAEGAAA